MISTRVPKGFTLIELMVVVSILAILVMIAAPSFNPLLERNRVKRAADTISAFLINTKSEAIKRNTTVRAVFRSASSGTSWCVGMTTANTCNCMTPNDCQIDSADRLVRGSDFKDIILSKGDGSSINGEMFSFTPLRGVANSGNAQVQSAGGLQIRTLVTGTGRIRLCSPSGDGNVGGYPVCP